MIEILRENVQPGGAVDLLLIGGEKLSGTVIRLMDDLLVLRTINGRERFISGAAILTLEVTADGPGETGDPTQAGAKSREVSRAEESQPEENDQDAPDPERAEDALQALEQIRATIADNELPRAIQLADELATRYMHSSETAQRDNTSRWVLVSAFKALEHQRKLLLAADKQHPRALQLSRALLSLNQALRRPSGLPAETVFTDLYHLYVCIRPHLDTFREDQPLWEELSRALRRSLQIGSELLDSPEQSARFTRQPHLRTTLMYRLSEICHAMVECEFASGGEKEELMRLHHAYAVKAGRSPKLGGREAVGKGKVVAFGQKRFGFIQTRDNRTLYFTLRDVATTALREQIERVGPETSVEVDFDEERRQGVRYDAALRVRPPNTEWGRIHDLRYDQDRRFGLIALPDNRLVRFWFAGLPDPENPPQQGTPVLCTVRRDPPPRYLQRGRPVVERWSTNQVILVDDLSEATEQGRAAQWFINEATAATQEGDLARAHATYDEGIRRAPTAHLYVAYGGWLKEHRRQDTEALYEKALRDCPDSYHLHESAGSFAATERKFDLAVARLERALAIVRSTPARVGEKGVLLALARVHYQIDSVESLRKSAAYFEEVAALFGGWEQFRARLPRADVEKADAAQAAVARLRTMADPIGEKTFEFLQGLGLDVVGPSELGKEPCANLVCEGHEAHLLADFGLKNRLLVRVSTAPLREDESMTSVEEAAKAFASSHETDAGVVLLIAPSVPEKLRKTLEDRKKPGPNRMLIVIPLAAADLDKVTHPQRLFRDTLAHWLWGRDVFTLTAPVSDDDFFGRGFLLADLHDRIAIGQPVGLFGLRKTGKTSVLQALRRREEDEGHLVIQVDLGEGQALEQMFSWLYWTLANELHRLVQKRLQLPVKWELGGQYHSHQSAGKQLALPDACIADFRRVLTALGEQPPEERPRVVVMLDEWENLYYIDTIRCLRTLGSLRSLQQSFPTVLSLVCTGASAAVSEFKRIKPPSNDAEEGIREEKSVQTSAQDNPVFGYFTPFYLPFLSEEVCVEMIEALGRRSGVSFASEAIGEIYRQTAGHPFITRELCAWALGDGRLRSSVSVKIARAQVIVAVRNYLEMRASITLGEIFDRFELHYPEEMDFLTRIACASKPVVALRDPSNPRQKQAGIIEHLRSYQIVEKVADGVRIRMTMLRDWLARR